MDIVVDTIKRSWVAKAALVFFIGVSLWWVTIYVRGLKEGFENNVFTLTYPWMSLLGGIAGLIVAKRWGGVRSVMGRSLVSISLGLLAQSFGQAAYAYYIYIQGIEVPYPSLGDVGYFGSVIFYFIGAIFLAKAVGAGVSLKRISGVAYVVVLPLIMLIGSYMMFLRGYETEGLSYTQIFLDFAYPLGQAIYVSVALLAVILSRKMLGGILRWPSLALLIALVVQYFSDYIFLYQNSQGTWYIGGPNDYMYFVSYFLMTFSLIQLGVAFNKLSEA